MNITNRITGLARQWLSSLSFIRSREGANYLPRRSSPLRSSILRRVPLPLFVFALTFASVIPHSQLANADAQRKVEDALDSTVDGFFGTLGEMMPVTSKAVKEGYSQFHRFVGKGHNLFLNIKSECENDKANLSAAEEAALKRAGQDGVICKDGVMVGLSVFNPDKLGVSTSQLAKWLWLQEAIRIDTPNKRARLEYLKHLSRATANRNVRLDKDPSGHLYGDELENIKKAAVKLAKLEIEIEKYQELANKEVSNMGQNVFEFYDKRQQDINHLHELMKQKNEVLVARPFLAHSSMNEWIDRTLADPAYKNIVLGKQPPVSDQEMLAMLDHDESAFYKDLRQAIDSNVNVIGTRLTQYEEIVKQDGYLSKGLDTEKGKKQYKKFLNKTVGASDLKDNLGDTSLIEELLVLTDPSKEKDMGFLRKAGCELEKNVFHDKKRNEFADNAVSVALIAGPLAAGGKAAALMKAGAVARPAAIFIATNGGVVASDLMQSAERSRDCKALLDMANGGAKDALKRENIGIQLKSCQESVGTQKFLSLAANLVAMGMDAKMVAAAADMRAEKAAASIAARNVEKSAVSDAGLANRFEMGHSYLKGSPELEETLGKIEGNYANLSDEKKLAIQKAHEVGLGGDGPYSGAEIKEKAKILKTAGFDKKEIEALMRGGVCGDENRIKAFFKKLFGKGTKVAEAADAVTLTADPPTGMKLDERGFMPGGTKGFTSQAGDINLITPAQLKKLPKGTVLHCIDGSTAIVGLDAIDEDVRGGFIAYGFPKSDEARAAGLAKAQAMADDARGIAKKGAATVASRNAEAPELPWRDAKKKMGSASKALSSSNKAAQLEAIRELGDVRIDIGSLKNLKPIEYNEAMLKVMDDLEKVVKTTTDPEIREAAFEAMSKYGRANSGNYKLGYLGRRGPEVIESIYYDKTLPEDIRRKAYDEMTFAYKQAGFGSFDKPFLTAKEMIAQEAERAQQIAQAEAKTQQNFQTANELSLKSRPSGESLGYYADREGYKPIEFHGWESPKGPKGMDTLPGKKTNVGMDAVVQYTPAGGQPVELQGKIVKEYQAGFDLQDANGNVHQINVNFGKINKTYVRSPDVAAKLASSGYERAQKEAKDLYAKTGKGNYWPTKDGVVELLTPSEVKALPKGTELYTVNGEKAVVGTDHVDLDTRGGYTAYGYKVDASGARIGAAASGSKSLPKQVSAQLDEIAAALNSKKETDRVQGVWDLTDFRPGEKYAAYADDPRVKKLVNQALEDSHPKVRQNAQHHLAGLSGDSTEGYRPIRHMSFRGMEHLPGQESNIGNLIVAEFTPTKGKAFKVTGRVIREYQAGMDVLDENGVIHHLNVNDGKITSALVKPDAGQWKQVPVARGQFENAVRSTKDPYGVFEFYVGDDGQYGGLHLRDSKLRIIEGRITQESIDGKSVYVVTDNKGERHIIDPKHLDGEYFGNVLITSASDAERAGLSKLAKADGYPPLDTRKPFKSYLQPSPEAEELKKQLKAKTGKGNYWPTHDGVVELLTPDEVKNLPKGTELYTINGEKRVVGKDHIDLDTRGGYTAYGYKVADVNGAKPTLAILPGKPLKWAEAEKEIKLCTTGALMSSKETQLKWIHDLGNLEIDIPSLKGLDPSKVNAKMVQVMDDLAKIITSTSDREVQQAALDAMSKYGRTNSGSYRLGYLGKSSPEVFDSLYHNKNLPDEIRRKAFDESNFAYKQVGLGSNEPFLTSQQMAEKEAAAAKQIANAKAAEIRAFKQANELSVSSRPAGEPLGTYADREGYKPIRRIDWQGMESLPGRKTNVGLDALVKFTPTDGASVELRGKVVREYQAGFDLQDAQGNIHHINVNYGKIDQVYVHPSGSRAKGVASATAEEAKPLHWVRAKQKIDFFLTDLADQGSRTKQLNAIKELGDVKFDWATFKGKNVVYNDTTMKVVSDLENVVKTTTDPEIREAALDAMAKYSRANSANYTHSMLGYRAPEYFGSIYGNTGLPDAIRRKAYDEMRFAFEHSGEMGKSALEHLGKFQTAREMLAEEAARAARFAEAKAKELRNFQTANDLAISSRPGGEPLAAFAEDQGYKPIRHNGFDGMETLPGTKTNVGNEAFVSYTPADGVPVEIHGTITKEYGAGFDIKDANGNVHSINANFGKINQTYVKPAGGQVVAKAARSVGAASASKAPMKWAEAEKEIKMATVAATHPDISKEAQLAWIHDIGDLKIDTASLKGVKPEVYNDRIMSVIDKLEQVVKTSADPEVQRAAMDAMAKYGRVNSDNYTRGYLGRRAPEAFDDIYRDKSLPDDIRRRAYDEANFAYEKVGFSGKEPFKTADQMRAEEAAQARRIAEEKATRVRNFRSANDAAVQSRPGGESLATYAKREGYHPLEFHTWDSPKGPIGMDKLAGTSSNVGHEVLVKYTPTGVEPVELRGKVVAEYNAGFDLQDANGNIHHINANFGKIDAVYAKPSGQ